MQIVDRAMQFPAYCFWTFKTDADNGGPWLDLGRDFDERHQGRMYLQVAVAREIGTAAGCITPDAYQETVNELEAARERVAELEGQVRQLEEFKQSVYVMRSEGYTTAKKPGRPPNKVKEQAGAR